MAKCRSIGEGLGCGGSEKTGHRVDFRGPKGDLRHGYAATDRAGKRGGLENSERVEYLLRRASGGADDWGFGWESQVGEDFLDERVYKRYRVAPVEIQVVQVPDETAQLVILLDKVYMESLVGNGKG